MVNYDNNNMYNFGYIMESKNCRRKYKYHYVFNNNEYSFSCIMESKKCGRKQKYHYVVNNNNNNNMYNFGCIMESKKLVENINIIIQSIIIKKFV
jgi:hypothetical protein